jgi:CubicO group peptidase (beta-lactamase class C family)
VRLRVGLSGLVPLLLLTGCAGSAGVQPVAHESNPDAEVRRLMQREGVNGLALALIEGGQVTRVAAYGRRNVERDLPLTSGTIMPGASFTKTAFAYLVLQLVD